MNERYHPNQPRGSNNTNYRIDLDELVMGNRQKQQRIRQEHEQEAPRPKKPQKRKHVSIMKIILMTIL
ncbi:MAG: hypothetical protein IJG36_09965, partial [Synergistaceae bacterium]|nr:hypothetical protein [Synergistaceae bacterium]